MLPQIPPVDSNRTSVFNVRTELEYYFPPPAAVQTHPHYNRNCTDSRHPECVTYANELARVSAQATGQERAIPNQGTDLNGMAGLERLTEPEVVPHILEQLHQGPVAPQERHDPRVALRGYNPYLPVGSQGPRPTEAIPGIARQVPYIPFGENAVIDNSNGTAEEQFRQPMDEVNGTRVPQNSPTRPGRAVTRGETPEAHYRRAVEAAMRNIGDPDSLDDTPPGLVQLMQRRNDINNRLRSSRIGNRPNLNTVQDSSPLEDTWNPYEVAAELPTIAETNDQYVDETTVGLQDANQAVERLERRIAQLNQEFMVMLDRGADMGFSPPTESPDLLQVAQEVERTRLRRARMAAYESRLYEMIDPSGIRHPRIPRALGPGASMAEREHLIRQMEEDIDFPTFNVSQIDPSLSANGLGRYHITTGSNGPNNVFGRSSAMGTSSNNGGQNAMPTSCRSARSGGPASSSNNVGTAENASVTTFGNIGELNTVQPVFEQFQMEGDTEATLAAEQGQGQMGNEIAGGQEHDWVGVLARLAQFILLRL